MLGSKKHVFYAGPMSLKLFLSKKSRKFCMVVV